MFLNVLGHMQLPVLALLTGNSCPSVVSQYCGVAQVTSTLCTGHCSLHFESLALLPFQTTQRAAPVTPSLCSPCLVMGRTTLKFPCSSSTTSKGSNSCRHWQTTPTFTSHFQLLQVVKQECLKLRSVAVITTVVTMLCIFLRSASLLKLHISARDAQLLCLCGYLCQ